MCTVHSIYGGKTAKLTISYTLHIVVLLKRKIACNWTFQFSGSGSPMLITPLAIIHLSFFIYRVARTVYEMNNVCLLLFYQRSYISIFEYCNPVYHVVYKLCMWFMEIDEHYHLLIIQFVNKLFQSHTPG